MSSRSAIVSPSARRGEAGVTLIELMIAIVLAAVLSAGLFYMMSGQSRTYRTQLENTTTQENLWGAMELVQRGVRQAGYGVGACPGGDVWMYDSTSTAIPPVTPSPRLIPIRVYNDCDLMRSDPRTDCPDGSGVDSLTVSSAPMSSGMIATRLTDAMLTSSDQTFVASPGMFANGDYIVFWQPGVDRLCTLLRMTGDPIDQGAGRYELPHVGIHSINPPIGTNIFPSLGYDKEALVVNVTAVMPRHFAIDYDPSDPNKVPRLVTWTTDQPNPMASQPDLEVVADGIEDMQLSFACDDGPSGTPNGTFDEGVNETARLTDEWAYNVAGEQDVDGNGLPDPMTCDRGIGAVRITLIARSASSDSNVRDSKRPAAEDHAAGVADGFHRRTLTALVHPRNVRTP